MAELHLVDKLMNALSALHTEVLLFDEQGETIPAGFQKKLPTFSPEERIVISDGYAWCRVQASPVAYVAAAGTDARAVDCVRLAASLAEAYNVEPAMHGKLDVYRSVLREELSGPELETLAGEYGIPIAQERCIILFYGARVSLEDLIPMESGDTLIEMDRHTNVLIKSMKDIADIDELQQLADRIRYLAQEIIIENGRYSISMGIENAAREIVAVTARIPEAGRED